MPDFDYINSELQQIKNIFGGTEGRHYAVIVADNYGERNGFADWRVGRGHILPDAVGRLTDDNRAGAETYIKNKHAFGRFLGVAFLPHDQTRAFSASRLKPYWRFKSGSTGWAIPDTPSAGAEPPNQIELNASAARDYLRGFCGEVCQELVNHHAPAVENKKRARAFVEADYKRQFARVGDPSAPTYAAKLAALKKERSDRLARLDAFPDAIDSDTLDKLSYGDLLGLAEDFGEAADEAALLAAAAAALGGDPARINNYSRPDALHIPGLHSSVWDSESDLAEARNRDWRAGRELAAELSGHTRHAIGLAHLRGMTKSGGGAYRTRAERESAAAAAEGDPESAPPADGD